jgi:GNAT superfamily N-acetyltransferase
LRGRRTSSSRGQPERLVRRHTSTMSDDVLIRRASPAEIAEVISIDDDACALYETVGLHFDIGPDHPFAQAEHARWARAANDGNVFLAERAGSPAVAVLVVGRVGGLAYVDQLSVRMSAMRDGIGGRLLMRAIEWAGHDELWLTTYAHLPWNRPFYERHGFATVAESACPPGIVADLEEQRRWLPDPEQRIAMLRPRG